MKVINYYEYHLPIFWNFTPFTTLNNIRNAHNSIGPNEWQQIDIRIVSTMSLLPAIILIIFAPVIQSFSYPHHPHDTLRY